MLLLWKTVGWIWGLGHNRRRLFRSVGFWESEYMEGTGSMPVMAGGGPVVSTSAEFFDKRNPVEAHKCSKRRFQKNIAGALELINSGTSKFTNIQVR